MANQIKRTISISPESDYEIHRLAKMWGVKVAKARERCYHYAAVRSNERNSEVIDEVAQLRQAEAKVEMLRGR